MRSILFALLLLAASLFFSSAQAHEADDLGVSAASQVRIYSNKSVVIPEVSIKNSFAKGTEPFFACSVATGSININYSDVKTDLRKCNVICTVMGEYKGAPAQAVVSCQGEFGGMNAGGPQGSFCSVSHPGFKAISLKDGLIKCIDPKTIKLRHADSEWIHDACGCSWDHPCTCPLE